jgi:hypothetical protein
MSRVHGDLEMEREPRRLRSSDWWKFDGRQWTTASMHLNHRALQSSAV